MVIKGYCGEGYFVLIGKLSGGLIIGSSYDIFLLIIGIGSSLISF